MRATSPMEKINCGDLEKVAYDKSTNGGSSERRRSIMKRENQLSAVLELLRYPAFSVENDRIAYVNQKAKALMLCGGEDILPIIATGQEEYLTYEDGCLCLTITVQDEPRPATVQMVEGHKVFLLEENEDTEGFRMLSLTAQSLRSPLGDVMSAADSLLPVLAHWEDPAIHEQMARLNQGLYQILRIVGNMSDAGGYLTGSRIFAPESTELGGFFQELFQKAAALGTDAVQIDFQCPRGFVDGYVDRQKMERAVYNLLSNAIKHTPAGGRIQAKLEKKGKRAWLSIVNEGVKLETEEQGDLFFRYRREASLANPQGGVGLGLPIARQVAALHGGVILLTQTASGLQVAMSMNLQQPEGGNLGSPRLQPDYAGCRDHCLVELSGVLPASVFETGNIN